MEVLRRWKYIDTCRDGFSRCAPILASTSTTIVVGESGQARIIRSEASLSIIAPTNFASVTSNVVIVSQALEVSPVLSGLGRPSFNLSSGGALTFDVRAFLPDEGRRLVTEFTDPVRVTYTYRPQDASHLDERTLRIYHFHDDRWSGLEDCEVDTGARTVSCVTHGFSVFALFGREPEAVSIVSGGGGGGGERVHRLRISRRCINE